MHAGTRALFQEGESHCHIRQCANESLYCHNDSSDLGKESLTGLGGIKVVAPTPDVKYPCT